MRKAEEDELPQSSEEKRGDGDRVPEWTIRRQQLQEVLRSDVTDTLPKTDISAEKGNVIITMDPTGFDEFQAHHHVEDSGV